MPRVGYFVCFVCFVCSLVVACAAAEQAPRGSIDKADLQGSCTASACGGESDGNCYCDDACAGYGDCCSNKQAACPGGLVFANYNAGLAHGAVPLADERVKPIIEDLKNSPADVMCLQEVWTDEDALAIQNGIQGTFPYQFREKTENDISSWFACAPSEWLAMNTMNNCVTAKCTPSGISAFECAADQCAPEWAALDDHCKLCLAANASSPTSCAVANAPMYANGGRNGILLVSRTEMTNVSYTPFDTFVIKRGVIRADVAGYQVQCTHMTADLDVVPYPVEGAYRSWKEEHRAQVEVMAKQAGNERRTVLLGDLNTGPASAGVDGELPDNFAAVLAAGYSDTWTSGAKCTYCQDNPLACSKPEGCGGLSSRIDHALLRNFAPDVTLGFARFATQPITLVDADGRSHDGRLSDHYGITATMPY
jgi:endonuclease/exonuclease/phosphatase family metal-dependent hydrolase